MHPTSPMSLAKYRHPRLIIQNPKTPVQSAARAMEANRIGTVIVQDHGKVVGLVTDRDLALRVVGGGLDPKTTTLGEVMTTDVATLPIDADQVEAVRLMKERNARRIPLVEGHRVVGIVTLDDLLLDEAAPLEELASIVRAQIGEGGPAPTRRFDALKAAQRKLARAEETYGKLVNQIHRMTGLPNKEQAATALDVVLCGIVRRLTPQEASDFISQLPSLLHDRLLELPAGPDKSVTRASIEEALVKRLDIEPDYASRIVSDIGAALEQAVSSGQIDNVRSQLPKEMRSIFPSPSVF